MNSIVLPSDIEVVVASYGGVGTTFLLSFLSEYKKTNDPDDLDGFKHLALPPLSFNPNIRYIYVYGDPVMAAFSLFRRKIQKHQSKKLQKWIKPFDRPIPKKMPIEAYASIGKDKLYFEQHFYNWYQTYLRGVPTLFVRYESIFENAQKIIDFLGLPSESITKFPEKKGRTISKNDIDPEIIRNLESIYGGFAAKLSELEDVEYRRNGEYKFMPNRLLPYFLPLASDAPYIIKHFLNTSLLSENTIAR